MGVATVVSPERDLTQFDPFSPEVQADLTGWYDALRGQEPVHHNLATGYWFVTSRKAVNEALRNPAVFSSGMEQALKLPTPPEVAEEVGRIRANGYPCVRSLVYLDPPEHDRQRALLAKAFSPRIVRALEPDVTVIVDRLLDKLEEQQSADFVAELATPLPALVIAQMLNIGEERRDDFKRWADARATPAGNRPTPEQVFLVFAAANRDDACYPQPDQFDTCRPSPRQHLAFGRGKHFCLGAPVARLETAVAFGRMADRFEAPVLSSLNTYEHRPGFVIPGLNELLVELTPRTQG